MTFNLKHVRSDQLIFRRLTHIIILLVPWLLALYLAYSVRIYQYSSSLGLLKEMPLTFWIGMLWAASTSAYYALKAPGNKMFSHLSILQIICTNIYFNGLPMIMSVNLNIVGDSFSHSGFNVLVDREGNVANTVGLASYWYPGSFIFTVILSKVTLIDYFSIARYFYLPWSLFILLLAMAFARVFLKSPIYELSLLFLVSSRWIGNFYDYYVIASGLYFTSLLLIVKAMNSKHIRKGIAIALLPIIFTLSFSHHLMSILVTLMLAVMVFLKAVRSRIAALANINELSFVKFSLSIGFIAFFVWSIFGSPDVLNTYVIKIWTFLNQESYLVRPTQIAMSEVRQLNALFKIASTAYFMLLGALIPFYFFVRRKERSLLVPFVLLSSLLLVFPGLDFIVLKGTVIERAVILAPFVLLPSLIVYRGKNTKILAVLLVAGLLISFPAGYLAEIEWHATPQDVQGYIFVAETHPVNSIGYLISPTLMFVNPGLPEESTYKYVFQYPPLLYYYMYVNAKYAKEIPGSKIYYIYIFGDNVKNVNIFMVGNVERYEELYGAARLYRSLIYDNGAFNCYI